MLPLLLTAALALSPALAAEGWPDLSTPPKAAATRDGSKDAALVIAIEDYDHAQDLPGAVANGRAWVSYLKIARGVGTIKVLENGTATREEILAAARGLSERVQPGGRLWVVYIGHGAPASQGEGGMLVGVDARQTAMSLDARSVRLEELEAALDGPQAEVVLVQDACFSGKASSGDLAPGLAPLKAVSSRLGPKWTVLSAGRNDEYAGPLSDGSRPAFSYLVLGALRGWGDANRDGAVSAQEAVDFANDALYQTTTGRTQRPQRSGLDVALGRSGKERAPDLTALAMAAVSSPAASVGSAGQVQVDLGGSATDFAALAAQSAAADVAAADAAQKRAAAQAALDKERRRRLDGAAADVQAAAKRDFASISSLLSNPTENSRKVLEAWLSRYDKASVTIDGVTEAVSIPEVARVQQAIGRIAVAAAAVRQIDERARRSLVDEGAARLDDLERDLLAKAAADWDRITPALREGGAGGYAAARRFVSTYSDATVGTLVDGDHVLRRITIEELEWAEEYVSDARHSMESTRQAAVADSRSSSSAPVRRDPPTTWRAPAPPTTTQRSRSSRPVAWDTTLLGITGIGAFAAGAAYTYIEGQKPGTTADALLPLQVTNAACLVGVGLSGVVTVMGLAGIPLAAHHGHPVRRPLTLGVSGTW